MQQQFNETDIAGVIGDLPEPDRLREPAQRLTIALEGGAKYSRQSPEWLGFEALFWQSMDGVVAVLGDERADTVLERLETLGLSAKITGFLEGMEPCDISKAVTPHLRMLMEYP